MNQIIGACGDKCSACPRFKATVNKDTALLESILKLYVKLGHRSPGTDSGSLKCSGCWANGNCANPNLRACVALQELDNCGQCGSYPCVKINSVIEKTAEFREKTAGRASDRELSMFDEAFFRKKEYLDKIKNDRKKEH